MLKDDILAAAEALHDVSGGLAKALKPAAQRPNASTGVVGTFREAESLSLTVIAVLEQNSSVLALLTQSANVVGRRAENDPHLCRVQNGFDSLGLILLTLLRKTCDAVSDVASNQSQWLVSPLEARQSLEAMSIHHAQLKAMYGILHLASKLVETVDVSKSLFLDVRGDINRADLEPARWRGAIKMDAFFGRFFGFHYKPEMRRFLRVANIARGSIKSAVATAPGASSPIVRNIAALGWGWWYSNMVILNNLGLSIDGASKIGADEGKGPTDVEQVRAFMNLAEDPIVAGVTSLASADVAVDHVFQIVPYPLLQKTTEVYQEEQSCSDKVRLGTCEDCVLSTPSSPICARLISYRPRPYCREDLQFGCQASEGAGNPAIPVIDSKSLDGAEVGGDGAEVRRDGAAGNPGLPQLGECPRTFGKSQCASDEQPQSPVDKFGQAVRQLQQQIQRTLDFTPVRNAQSLVGSGLNNSNCEGLAPVLASDRGPAISQRPVISTDRSGARRSDVTGVSSNELGRVPSRSETVSSAADSSMLANAIKGELAKLQSNVSSFLVPDKGEAASHLIIYFHGGGFVSQSSGGHAVYVKEWASDVPDTVVLCIDYKLAPEYPYPTALEECTYAYAWALENCELIGTRAERVVLCGDSAGGNFAVSVALKAQALGLRKADGICIAYPALYVNVSWSPSRMLSFFDPLLPLSILDFCVQSYVGDTGAKAELGDLGPHKDPFMSPMIASEEQLRGLPRVAVISGSLDPLLDDAVQFVHNLRGSGRGADLDRLRVVDAMPHGFLNMIHVFREAREGMRFLSRSIADFLETPLGNGSRVSMENGNVDSSEAGRSSQPRMPTPTVLFDA